jgi:hypothetical protein
LFLASWLFYYATAFSTLQNIAIFLVSLVAAGILLTLLWVPRSLKPTTQPERHKDSSMNKDDLRVKDWEMAISQTTNLNNTIITLRVQGIPITIAILAIGFTAFQYVHGVKVLGVSALAFIPLFGSIYLSIIAMIDWFYFKPLLESIYRAMAIEDKSPPKT